MDTSFLHACIDRSMIIEFHHKINGATGRTSAVGWEQLVGITAIVAETCQVESMAADNQAKIVLI